MTIKMLKAMVGIVDANHLRYAITGVYVKGGVMQATNAITAARLTLDGVDMPEMIIPATSVKQMRDDGKGLEVLDGGLYRLGGVVFAPIDAQYPDFGRLTPSYHGGHSNSTGSFMGLDFAQLAKVGKLCKATAGVHHLPLTKRLLDTDGNKDNYYFRVKNLEIWICPAQGVISGDSAPLTAE
jgi:hypothetical protein